LKIAIHFSAFVQMEVPPLNAMKEAVATSLQARVKLSPAKSENVDGTVRGQLGSNSWYY
jgi:hypothetical protein